MTDTVHDFVAEVDEATRRSKWLVGVVLSSKSLTDMERSVIMLTVVGVSLFDIAADYQISRQRAGQLRNAAWRKIQHRIPGAVARPDWNWVPNSFSARKRKT